MGKFTVRQTATGFLFELSAANGETVAVSEVYRTRAACEKGIRGISNCAVIAPAAEITQENLPANPRFEIFTDKAGEFRFRLRARNGKIIASSQGYGSMQACMGGIESVRQNVQTQEQD